MNVKRIIFVVNSGLCRAPMACAILQSLLAKEKTPSNFLEVLARGLVVLFEEPLNQKAEAVMKRHGMSLPSYASKQFKDEDIVEGTLVFTMTRNERQKILKDYPGANEGNTFVLTEFVGDELEIIDPYGGDLKLYGLCFESLQKSIEKLVQKLFHNKR